MKRFFTPAAGSSDGKRAKGDDVNDTAATTATTTSETPCTKSPKTFMTWNCNSLLGRLRKESDKAAFARYVVRNDPDVIALQETWLPAAGPERRDVLRDDTKQYREDKQLIDTFLRQKPFSNYTAYWSCADMKRAGSGVLVKKELKPPLKVTRSLVSTNKTQQQNEGRVLLLEFDELCFLNVYATNNGWTPESMARRQQWDAELRRFLVDGRRDDVSDDALTRPRFCDTSAEPSYLLIPPGTVLKISGLVTRSDLNGVGCEVQSYAEDRERYRVTVQTSNEELYVRATNLSVSEPKEATTEEGEERGGSPKKKDENLQKDEKKKPLVWCGDLNACHRQIDVTHPEFFGNSKAEAKGKGKPAPPLPVDVNDRGQPGFTVNERKRFDELVNDANLVDTYRHLHGDVPNAMTWFGHPGVSVVGKYRGKGMRLDYFFVDSDFVENVVTCVQATDGIEMRQLEERPDSAFFGSDHCAVLMRLR